MTNADDAVARPPSLPADSETTFVPWREHAAWRTSVNWFRENGAQAFSSGEVPSVATCSEPAAKRLVQWLEAVEPADGRCLRVLEVGVGKGELAARALRLWRSQPRPWNLEYTLSDLSLHALAAIRETKWFEEAQTAGVARTAVFDLDVALRPRGFPGEEELQAQFDVLLFNYVACTLPTATMRVRGDEIEELAVDPHASLEALLQKRAGTQFVPVDPEAPWAAPHVPAIRASAEGLEGCNFSYPVKFLDALERHLGLVAPRGVMLVGDYGVARTTEVLSVDTTSVQQYGGSIAQGVNFVAVARFCQARGWAWAGRAAPLALVHVAAIAPSGAMPQALRDAVETDDGRADAFVDLLEAAAQARSTHPERSLRLLGEAERQDPENPEHAARQASLAIEAGLWREALNFVARAAQLNARAPSDLVLPGFDIHLEVGRALARGGKLEAAEVYYLRALELNPTPHVLCNLGYVYAETGRREAARQAFQRALELDPSSRRATEALELLQRQVLPSSGGEGPSEQDQAASNGYTRPSEHLDDLMVAVALWLEGYLAKYTHRLTDAQESWEDRYVSIAEALATLSEYRGEPTRPSSQFRSSTELATAQVGLAHHVQSRLAATSGPLPFDAVRERFDLSPIEERVLLGALAPQWSTGLARVYRFAMADARIRNTTVGFLEDLISSDPAVSRHEVARALDPHGRLASNGLIVLRAATGSGGPTLPDTQVSVSDVLIRWLRWHNALEPCPAWAALQGPLDAPPAPFRAQQELANTLHSWRRSHSPAQSPLRTMLVAPRGAGRRTALRLAGGSLLVLGERLFTQPLATMGWALRELGLAAVLHEVPVVIDLSSLPGPMATDELLTAELLAFSATSPAEIVWLAPDDTTARRFAALGVHRTLHLAPLSLDEWSAMRGQASGDRAVDPEVLVHSRLGLWPGQIAHAQAHSARVSAQIPTRGPESSVELPREVARLARLVPPVQRLSDLVLPASAMERLNFLIQCAIHQNTVFEQWGFATKVSTGRALSALFFGPPGTGKTMAATALAAELGRPLLRVDLSGVVDKYVGETEKNLGSLFDYANSAQPVLLFDEADALFAKRTEVKSSNDRYANLEVNYLLQRMEQFEGICILTTNFIESIDDAMQRRIAIKVSFPFPSIEERADIWRKLIPKSAPLEPDIDWLLLAETFELAGGYIKNAVLAAAFAAASKGGAIGLPELWQGAVASYLEQGRLLPPHLMAPP